MSRAINIAAPAADVVAACAKHEARISVIETLPDGGTRVVLVSGDGAATIRRAFRAKLLPDRSRRTPLALPGWRS